MRIGRDICEYIFLILGTYSDAFAEWAVGENYKTMLFKNWPEEWNKRHGYDLILHDDDEIIPTLDRMMDLFINEKKVTDPLIEQYAMRIR